MGPGRGGVGRETDPGYQVLQLSPTHVRMLAQRAAGTIDARGAFTQPRPDSDYRADFTLARVDGQWRIASLPQGLILSTGDISRAYRAISLYYLDPARDVLVPDPVFLPTQEPGLATTMVRELLEPPTAWLAPAVTTAFPAGTRLAIDAVPVEDGVARVDLDTHAVGAGPAARQALAAQLTYTLAQLPDVIGVRITVSGLPFAVPRVGDVTTTTDWPQFAPAAAPLDPSTYAIVNGHLTRVTGSAQRVAGYFGSTDGLLDAATSLDGTGVAGVYDSRAGARSCGSATRSCRAPTSCTAGAT